MRQIALAVGLWLISGVAFAQGSDTQPNLELLKNYLKQAEGSLPSSFAFDITYLAIMAEKTEILTDIQKAELDELGMNFLRCHKKYFAIRKETFDIFSMETLHETQLNKLRKELDELSALGAKISEDAKHLLDVMPPTDRWSVWEYTVESSIGSKLVKHGSDCKTSDWKLNNLASRIDYLANLMDKAQAIDRLYSDVLDRVGTGFIKGRILFCQISKLKVDFANDPLKTQSKKLELNKKITELNELGGELEADYNFLIKLTPNSPRWKLWGEKVAGDKNSGRPDDEWCGGSRKDK